MSDIRRLLLSSLALCLVPLSVAVAQTHRDLATLSAGKERFTWTIAPIDSVTEPAMRGRHDELGLRPKEQDALSEIFRPEGLLIRDQLVPSAQLVLTFKTIKPDQVEMGFSTSDSAASPSEVAWVADTSYDQPVGEFWPGDIVVFGGSATIGGEVGGNVLVFGGDAVVREAATVRGGVVVIGGILRQRGDGKIYGQVFSPAGHRRPRLSVTRAWQFENEGVQWGPSFSFDRVDGARMGGHLAYQKSPYSPRFLFFAGYAIASETWQYRFKLQQQVLRSAELELHASIFRLTETEDEKWVGRNANTAYALLTGSDYRDYFGADGGEFGVTYKYRERGTLSAVYSNTDYRWLDAERGLWHLFRPNHLFRENFSTVPMEILVPWIDRFEERTSALHLIVGVERRESTEHPAKFDGGVKAHGEIAGGVFGGERDYDRWQLDATGVWNREKLHRISARLWYGKGRRDLPPNKFFYLGGIGSLPGYPQKIFVGSQAFLASLEYRFDCWPDQPYGGAIMLFFDLGRATFDDDFFELAEFKSDVGVGFGLGDGLRLDVAKGLDRTDRDIRLTLGFKRKW